MTPPPQPVTAQEIAQEPNASRKAILGAIMRATDASGSEPITSVRALAREAGVKPSALFQTHADLKQRWLDLLAQAMQPATERERRLAQHNAKLTAQLSELADQRAAAQARADEWHAAFTELLEIASITQRRLRNSEQQAHAMAETITRLQASAAAPQRGDVHLIQLPGRQASR